MFSFRKKLEIPSADEALPGRSTRDPHRAAAFRQRPRAQGPLSRRARHGDVRARLFLGRRAQVLGARRRRLCHRGRLCRRPDAEPDLRGSLQRPHRPQRSRARGLRPEEDLLRAPAQDVLGKPRPDPGHAPGQRRRHPIPLRHLCVLAGTARRRRSLEGGLRQGARGRTDGADHHGNPRRAAVLFRRGLSPAISGEESARLLRPRRHRRELPDRHGSGGCVHYGANSD